MGSTRVGSTLSVNPDAATSAVGVALSYQWMVDGQDVQGATGSTMTLTSAHAGKVVAVKVTYTAAGGRSPDLSPDW